MKLLKVTKTEYNSAGQLVVTAVGAKSTFSAEDCAAHGTDSRPVPGELVLYNDTEKIGDEFMVGYLVTQRKAEPGEHRIFCTDADGNFKFNAWLRADGTVLIGDSDAPADYTNFAAKYNELKAGFDELKQDHNDVVTLLNSLIALYNSHVHPYVNVTTPSVTSVTGSAEGDTASPSAASIADSKNEKVKFN